METKIKNKRYKKWDNGWELRDPFELYPWQTTTYLSRKKQPRHMDFSDAGTGKSLPVLCNLFNWMASRVVTKTGVKGFLHGKEKGELRNAIIYTPPSARVGWILDAFPKFKNVSAELVEYSGILSKRRKLRRRVEKLNAEGVPVILLVSWGLMSHDSPEDLGWIHATLDPHYVIADEAQYISGHSSSRSDRFIRSIMYPNTEKDFKFVHFITATPFSNHMQQAWPYIYVCYENRMTGCNTAYPGGHQEFISHHFRIADDSRDPRGYRLDGFKDKDRVEKVIRAKGVVHKRKDVFKDRKEPVVTVKTFPLDSDQSALYWYFVNNLYIDNDETGEKLEVQDSNTRMMRERQLASNPAMLDFPDAKNKVKLLFETLEEYGVQPGKISEKVLILTEFRHTWTDLKEKLEAKGYKVAGIRGGDSMKSRLNAIKTFTDDPSIQIFIGSRKSMAEGVNLQAASIHIDYELGWEADKFIQGRGRVDRSGQKNLIYYIAFAAEETIDYLVYNRISKKVVFFDDLLSGTAEETSRVAKMSDVKSMLKAVGLGRKRPRLSDETKQKLKALCVKELTE